MATIKTLKIIAACQLWGAPHCICDSGKTHIPFYIFWDCFLKLMRTSQMLLLTPPQDHLFSRAKDSSNSFLITIGWLKLFKSLIFQVIFYPLESTPTHTISVSPETIRDTWKWVSAYFTPQQWYSCRKNTNFWRLIRGASKGHSLSGIKAWTPKLSKCFRLGLTSKYCGHHCNQHHVLVPKTGTLKSRQIIFGREALHICLKIEALRFCEIPLL